MLLINAKETEPLKPVQKFPYLAKFRLNQIDYFIVLFHKKGCGTIVLNNSYNSNYEVGKYLTDQLESNYSPFIGEVILNNDNS